MPLVTECQLFRPEESDAQYRIENPYFDTRILLSIAGVWLRVASQYARTEAPSFFITALFILQLSDIIKRFLTARFNSSAFMSRRWSFY
jgi:hypothetical protein